MTLPDIAPPLLRWYEQNKRTLPFRTVSTPYRVWVSEIMLQQTRVSAALPYFERFMAELPTVADLAACDPERLHKLWEGLGYYSRVRNLQKAAQIVMEQHGGALPADYDALLKLPGVGAYTAGLHQLWSARARRGRQRAAGVRPYPERWARCDQA